MGLGAALLKARRRRREEPAPERWFTRLLRVLCVQLHVRVLRIGRFGATRRYPGLPIFSTYGGLVLGCIEADFCKQILTLKHFARSTTFAHVCTDPISKCSQILAIFSPKCWQITLNLTILTKFVCKLSAKFKSKVRRFVTKFRQVYA